MLLSAMIALGGAWSGQAARGDVALEQQVKCAFVVNFVQFVDWPESAFSKADDPVILGVVDPGIMEGLTAAVAGKTVKGRKLEIRQFSPASVGKCHMLLTGGLEGGDLDAALKSGGAGVLTVGDSGRLTEAGGIVAFYLEDRKVRFEINLTAAQRAQLQISSKLLKLARVVNK